jgi:hypothetical protein
MLPAGTTDTVFAEVQRECFEVLGKISKKKKKKSLCGSLIVVRGRARSGFCSVDVRGDFSHHLR